MKVAGRKNDGAWFRANKQIKKLNLSEPAEAQNLQDVIAGLASMTLALNALKEMADEAGLDSSNPDQVPQSEADWADTLAHKGIPRQIWTGELSLDVYLPPGSSGNTKTYYVKKHGSAFRALGIDIRYVVTQFFNMRRQVIDLQNVKTRAQGNVGGVADATKNT